MKHSVILASALLASVGACSAQLDADDIQSIERMIRREYSSRPGVAVETISFTKTDIDSAIGFVRFRGADGESVAHNCFINPGKSSGRFTWKCAP